MVKIGNAKLSNLEYQCSSQMQMKLWLLSTGTKIATSLFHLFTLVQSAKEEAGQFRQRKSFLPPKVKIYIEGPFQYHSLWKFIHKNRILSFVYFFQTHFILTEVCFWLFSHWRERWKKDCSHKLTSLSEVEFPQTRRDAHTRMYISNV